jgi:hypothetical protein
MNLPHTAVSPQRIIPAPVTTWSGELPRGCPPPKLTLGMDNFIDILNRMIAQYANAPASEIDDMSIAILLRGLRETFPSGK